MSKSASKSTSLDIQEALTSFFKRPRWVLQTVYLALIQGVFFVAMLLSLFVWIIPVLGWILGLFLILFVVVLSVAFNLYLSGYKYEVADAVARGKNLDKVLLFSWNPGRFTHGVKLFVAKAVYTIPLIVIYTIGVAFMLIPAAFSESTCTTTSYGYDDGYYGYSYDYYDDDYEVCTTDENDTLYTVMILLSACVFFLGMPYQILLQYFIDPPLIAQYQKEGTVSSMFRLSDIFRFLKRNLGRVLLYAAITFGVAFVFQLAFMFGAITLFLFVGFVLLPFIMALFTEYTIYVQAHMIGQMIASDES